MMGLHRVSTALAAATVWIIACSSAANIDAIAGADGGPGTSDAGTATSDSSVPASPVTIGGTVSGLLGSGLVLQNNDGDDIAVSANGTFTFATKLVPGTSYAVTVKTQPSAPSQTCAVASGTGTTGVSDVSNVVVNCSTTTFTIGGSVSGLLGSGLVLQNNFGGEVAVTADGAFTFPAIPDGSNFDVTVKSQPAGPPQTCSVANGSGKLASANVSDVTVTCEINKYTIGGNVSGLVGTIVLTNNGGDDKTISADGAFTFATSIETGGTYDVKVKTQSVDVLCSVASGSGGVSDQDVTTVAVTCVSRCALDPVVFDFTGSEQTITVPACASSVTIKAMGAQGSDAAIGGTGGLGGSADGDLAVTAGDVLHVFVGGRNGYNGGGAGGQIGNPSNGIKGGLGPSGGGASDIRLNGSALSDRVIVAGGGGGAGTNGVWEGCQVAGPAGNGGAGGALDGLPGTAGVGTPCNCKGGGGDGGQGGTQSGGGAYGGYAGNTACLRGSWTAGQPGALGQGGAGSLTYYNGTGGGGGGGGGYYGGGSGGSGSDTTPGGGGGGGSSFVGTLTNASTSAGVRSGEGVVVITFN